MINFGLWSCFNVESDSFISLWGLKEIVSLINYFTCFFKLESGNKSVPSSEAAMKVSLEIHHTAYEQKGKQEKERIQKEIKQRWAQNNLFYPYTLRGVQTLKFCTQILSFIIVIIFFLWWEVNHCFLVK